MTAYELREKISENSQAWHDTENRARRRALHQENERLYKELDGLTGSTSTFDETTGHWSTTAPGAGDYVGTALPEVRDLSGEVRAMQTAATRGALAGLQRAKGEAMGAIDREEKAIDATYQAAKNRAAAQGEVEKQSFAQQAVQSGLNSGAAGQVALSRSMALQGELGELERQEAQAHAQSAQDRREMEADYAYAVQEAQAEGDYALADALYKEAARYSEAQTDRAVKQEGLDREVYELARDNRREEADQQARADELRYEQIQDAYERAWKQDERDYERAQASDEAAREADKAAREDYELRLKEAETRAKYGDFQGYARLGYSQREIETMTRLWRYYLVMK